MNTPPRGLALGACLSLASVLLGFGLGGVFGANEDAVKARLRASGDAALATAYQGDVAKKDGVVDKSFRYLVRGHQHWSGIGAAGLAAAAALAAFGAGGVLPQASAVSLGAGALLYGLFWVLAGFLAPGLGGTGAAKEALKPLAVPGAGLAILGALGALLSIARDAALSRGDEKLRERNRSS